MEFTFIDAVNNLLSPFDSLEEALERSVRSGHHRWSKLVASSSHGRPASTVCRRRRQHSSILRSTSTFPNVFRLCQNTLDVLLSAWR